MNFTNSRPCQTLRGSKSALIVSKDDFNRFTDFTTESEKMAAIAAKKSEKLAELKKASYEMTKNWDNTLQNIQKRRREELLSRRKKADEARVKFIKEMTEQNAKERAEIIKEARKLILYRKPQCRLINRALLTSECYRELNAQLEFKKTLDGIEEERDKEYAEKIKKDSENYIQEERKKAEEKLKKMQIYREELKKQMMDSDSQLKKLELLELNADKVDLNNMIKELKLIEKCEAEQIAKRKRELKQMYLDSMKEKKCQNEKMKYNEERENRLIQAYTKAKEQLNRMTKLKWKQSQADKLRRSELMAGKCAVIWQSRDAEAEEGLNKAVEEQTKAEVEKMKSKKELREKIRADMKKYYTELAAANARRAEEQKHLNAWETLQRYKRDEYNKEMRYRELQNDWKKKMQTAADLRKQMEEQEALRKEEMKMDDDSEYVKATLDKTNQKVLAYGEEVLEESKNVRPLFPIIKAIELYKKQNNLYPPKKIEEVDMSPESKRRTKKIFTHSPCPEQTFCFG